MRWKPAPEDAAQADAGLPDALAMFNAEGELIGWDESAAHAYIAERGQQPTHCNDACAARGHVDPW